MRNLQDDGDILGFRGVWKGSSTGTVLSWINMKVPDGSDGIEFMLYKDLPAADQRGSAHHLCLEVPSVSGALDGKPAVSSDAPLPR